MCLGELPSVGNRYKLTIYRVINQPNLLKFGSQIRNPCGFRVPAGTIGPADLAHQVALGTIGCAIEAAAIGINPDAKNRQLRTTAPSSPAVEIAPAGEDGLAFRYGP